MSAWPPAAANVDSASRRNRHHAHFQKLVAYALQDLGIDGIYADGTTAAALNSNALQAALAAVSPAIVDRYRTSGWQLNFATDALVSDRNAEKFIRKGAMAFSPQQDGSSSGRGTVQVTAPVLTSNSVGEVRKMAAAGKPDDPGTAAMLAAADDPYMVRFLGNWYTKVGRAEHSATVHQAC